MTNSNTDKQTAAALLTLAITIEESDLGHSVGSNARQRVTNRYMKAWEFLYE